MTGLNPKLLNFDASRKISFKFWVKGPSDAVIILAPNATATSQDEKRYEVIISGAVNRISWIRRMGPWSMDNTPHVRGSFLNVSEYRPFWLSWANQNITVGRGEQIGIDVVSFKDISPDPIDINYLFIRSYGTYTVLFKYFYYNGN